MLGDTVAPVFLLGAMTVMAQQKPDFSGEWKLNLQASTLSPIVAPVAQSGVLRIEHHEPKFTAHQTIVLDGKPFESNFELLSDGREVVADAGGRRIGSTLRWDGDALVFTSRIDGPGVQMTSRFDMTFRTADTAFERRNRFAAPIMIRTTPGCSIGVEQAVHDS
jgi:hypothetical protein